MKIAVLLKTFKIKTSLGIVLKS